MHFTAPVTLKEGRKLDIKSGKLFFVRKLLVDCWVIVRQLSGDYQAVASQLSCSCQTVMLLGGHKAVLKWSSGICHYCQAVVRRFSGDDQAVVWWSSGGYQAFLRWLSSSDQVGVGG